MFFCPSSFTSKRQRGQGCPCPIQRPGLRSPVHIPGSPQPLPPPPSPSCLCLQFTLYARPCVRAAGQPRQTQTSNVQPEPRAVHPPAALPRLHESSQWLSCRAPTASARTPHHRGEPWLLWALSCPRLGPESRAWHGGRHPSDHQVPS